MVLFTKAYAKYWVPVALIIGVFAGVGGFGLLKSDGKHAIPARSSASATTNASVGTTPKPAERAGMSPIRQVMNAYLGDHQKTGRDVFWLRGDESPTDHIKAIEHWEPLFRQIIAQYQDVTPMTKRCFAEFGKFSLSEFYEGISRRAYTGPGNAGTQELENALQGGNLEVCVVPENQWMKYGRAQLPSSLYYRRDWGALMITALVRPVGITAALFYHEMGHALRHRIDHAPSAAAPAMTDLWISEEVELHEMEFAIMDKVADGKFSLLLNAIIDRAGPNAQPMDVANAVTREDFAAYDRMFNLDEVGATTISSTTAQFLISLMFKSADRMVRMPSQLPAVKINMYRLVTRL